MKKKTNKLQKVDEFLEEAVEVLENFKGNNLSHLQGCKEKLWEALEIILDLTEPLRKK